jgi:hypothetical protein
MKERLVTAGVHLAVNGAPRRAGGKQNFASRRLVKY